MRRDSPPTFMEFPASQLGNEMQQQSALQGGVQQMSAPATTSLAGIIKEFGLVDFPFSVANYAQADALLDGPLGQALIAKLPEKGLVALGYWDLGFRNVTNSSIAPIASSSTDTTALAMPPRPSGPGSISGTAAASRRPLLPSGRASASAPS